MRILSYRVIIQKDGEGYHGFVPALLGCHSYGDSIEELRENIKEAIVGWIEATKEKGWDIPTDHTMETLESVEVDLPNDSLKVSSYV